MEPFSDLDHDVPLAAKQMDDLDISEELLENIKKPVRAGFCEIYKNLGRYSRRCSNGSPGKGV